MSVGDSAILSITLFVRTIAIVMRVLGAEAPAARLPEGALLFNVVGM